MSTFNSSDVFAVARDNTLYHCIALDVPDVLSTDRFIAQSTSDNLFYTMPASRGPTTPASTWLAASRAGVVYKLSGTDFREAFRKPTIDFEITLTAPDLTFELRIGTTVPTAGTVLGKVLWGDGSPIETITQSSNVDQSGFFDLSAPIMSHTYASAGTYVIRYRTRDLINPFFFSSPIKTQLRKVFNPLEGIRLGGSWTNPIAFEAQTELREVSIGSGAEVTSLRRAFSGCTKLETFNVADGNLSNVTSIYQAFAGLAGTAGPGFSIQGGMNWRGLTGSQGVQFDTVFGQSKVLAIGAAGNPVLMPTAQDYSLNFFANLTSGDNGANSLVGVYFDTLERCTSFVAGLGHCRGLEVFSVANGNMSKVTNINTAFANAGTAGPGFSIQGGMNWRGLTGSQGDQFISVFAQSKVLSIGAAGNPVLMPTAQNYSFNYFANLTSGDNGAASLTAVYFDTVRKCTSMAFGFAFCTTLSTFLVTDTANGFDEITNLAGAFVSCALSQASVDHILLLCVNGGQSTVTLGLNGGTNATPSATGLDYKATLVSRGWTVIHN